MAQLPQIPQLPEGMSAHIHLPSLTRIAGDPQFPAYLRLAAMDIFQESYSTVGSILSNMCPQDLGSVLGSWMSQIHGAQEEAEESGNEEGALIMRVSNPATFSYMLFTTMIARAEAGETKFDPILTGFQAELLSTFMQALVVANQFDRIKLDLTRFTLNMDFLDQDFDQVLSTDNFKAMKYVTALTAVWKKMRKSEILTAVRGSKEPKKEELVRAPATPSRFKARQGAGIEKVETKTEAKPSEVGDLEARLRRLSGG